jgi:phage N-6-adenine-methyltransferase
VKMVNNGMFSSLTDNWSTPPELFKSLDEEFHFTLDACATASNATVPNFYDSDSLEKPWTGVVWCNPPYGREIGKWIRKGRQSALEGAIVVMLIPSRTDTRWWHEDVMLASDVRFIKGRLKFGGSKSSAPFPSAIVVFCQDAPKCPACT